jgi:hypothetical protein
MTGYVRITRKEFYQSGSFSNPRLVRTQRGNCWAYFRSIE